MNKKTIFHVLFAFLVILGTSLINQVSAQTVLVNYDFASAVAGTPCTATPLTTASGITSTFSTGGTGGGTCTVVAGTASTASTTGAFVSNASNQSVSLTSFAAGSSNYFQFQLNGVSTFQDYSIFFQAQRSGTGPVNADVQYSIDGVTFTTFQTVAVTTSFATSAFRLDLSTVTVIENQATVYFRVAGRDGTGGGGTFRIDNFQVAAVGPTSASAEVGGRVTQPSGRGISGATVTMTDTQGGVRTATTNPFGYFRFSEVEAGQTYIFSAAHRRYRFDQPIQVRYVTEDGNGIDFIGSNNASKSSDLDK